MVIYLYLHMLIMGSDSDLLQNELMIRLNMQTGSGHYGTVEVVGIAQEMLEQLEGADLTPAEWRRFFAVYTGSEVPVSGDMPPILGTYEINGGVIRFIPRFPLVKELAYSARFSPAVMYMAVGVTSPPAEPPVDATFSLPRPPGSETTVVSHIYPGKQDLPENLLKFYIHFSAPMRRGQVYDFIRLIDESGNEVQGAFLELDPELWDRDARRLTLFFDPGRIKRGLRPNIDLGMALGAGQRYRLVIDREMKDAYGERMRASYEKEFTAGAADRSSPDYTAWRLTSPASGTTAPVILDFPESLDHALLGRMVEVVDASGRLIDGSIEVTGEETRWQFTPINPWSTGAYHIRIDPLLEDLAGNMLHRLFDVDTQNEQEAPTGESTYVILPFQVK